MFTSNSSAQSNITFNRDIAPIIFNHCSACHRPGEATPFSLLDFNDVSKRGAQIVKVTHDRFMPPWLPEQGRATFVGERMLDKSQIRLIEAWVIQGMVEGDPNDLKPLPKFPGDDWKLGPPDLVLTIKEPFAVAAEGLDIVRTFVLPVQLPNDAQVRAIDLKPGNPKALHHAAFLVDTTGSAKMLDDADTGPGYPGMGDIGLNQPGTFGNWSSSVLDGKVFPDGVARLLPKTCDLVAEMHFKPTGKVEQMQPAIGVYFAKKPAEKILIPITMGTYSIDIAPDEKAYTVRDSLVLPVEVDLYAIAPHAHYICRRMNVMASLEGGTDLPVLRIPDWDFNWQQEYRYLQPIHLPAGAKLQMEYVYDNSEANPRNPSNPPQRVRDGANPTDEMGIVFLHVTTENVEAMEELKKFHRQQQIKRMTDEARAKVKAKAGEK